MNSIKFQLIRTFLCSRRRERVVLVSDVRHGHVRAGQGETHPGQRVRSAGEGDRHVCRRGKHAQCSGHHAVCAARQLEELPIPSKTNLSSTLNFHYAQ